MAQDPADGAKPLPHAVGAHGQGGLHSQVHECDHRFGPL
jgi:hypothetical protein